MSSLYLNSLFRGGNTTYRGILYCVPSVSNFRPGLNEKHVKSYKAPLLPTELEAKVIKFISAGEWLYIATVCKRWRKLYLHNCRVVVIHRPLSVKATCIVSCAMASVNRLEIAVHAGISLRMDNFISVYSPSLGKDILKPMRFVAAILASKEVLKRAKELGMRWDAEVCYGAAQAGRLDLLMAKAPNSDVLRWLHIRGFGKWPEACGHQKAANIEAYQEMMALMRDAARHGRIENAKYLLSVGAIFHPFTCYAATIGNHIDFLEWARSEGCRIEWKGFRCSFARRRGVTQQTLLWLHEQDGSHPCGECSKALER